MWIKADQLESPNSQSLFYIMENPPNQVDPRFMISEAYARGKAPLRKEKQKQKQTYHYKIIYRSKYLEWEEKSF